MPLHTPHRHWNVVVFELQRSLLLIVLVAFLYLRGWRRIASGFGKRHSRLARGSFLFWMSS